MSAERSGAIPLCPNWRRYVVVGGWVLALCGKEEADAKLRPDNEASHLEQCPWFKDDEAYEAPSILHDPLSWPEILTRFGQEQAPIPTITSPFPGKKGIEFLEGIWGYKERQFIRRHVKS